jgi:hypothetical protein
MKKARREGDREGGREGEREGDMIVYFLIHLFVCYQVFVQFEDIADAQRAEQALAGRMYQGRTVICAFFPEKRFKRGDF